MDKMLLKYGDGHKKPKYGQKKPRVDIEKKRFFYSQKHLKIPCGYKYYTFIVTKL